MLAVGGSSVSRFFAGNSSCNTLLRELQQIWSDIGETETDKDRMFSELERECYEIYRRKVDEASSTKALLHQSIAAKEAELMMLMATLGEINVSSQIQSDNKTKSLKEQLASITPLLEDLKRIKEERVKQIADIKSQIDKISNEISGYGLNLSSVGSLSLEEQDLSLRKLSEYQSNLRALQKEKSERLQKVLDYVNEVHSLSGVLNLDFGKTVSEVHPSLQGSDLEHGTNVSDNVLQGLDQTIQRLKSERKFRFQKLKDVASSLSELWKLMDTPLEEKANFLKLTSILSSPESTVTQQGVLSTEIIDKVQAEVHRMTKLKASRLKELVMKKRSELEDLCRGAHIQPDNSTAADKTSALIDSGLVDPCEILANIEAQISKAKEEALSRKEIMDRIDRWLSACEEESWLEEYNLDKNRYSAGRGVHINLKRAERARITVNKIPVMVDNLLGKTLAWEDQKQKLFLYDGVRLFSILEDYKLARRNKEEEKKRSRDQKKLQDMLLAEKEAIYGSKPSPRRPASSYRSKPNGYCNGSVTPSPRRSTMSGFATPEPLTPRSYAGRPNGHFKELRRLSTGPLNFVAIPKEDTMSFSSLGGSEPESPPQM